jgi:hypothetical protein
VVSASYPAALLKKLLNARCAPPSTGRIVPPSSIKIDVGLESSHELLNLRR